MRRLWSRDTPRQRERQEALQALWTCLRERRLRGCRFRRQHPIAGYVADFACVEAGLVVEIDRGDLPERRDYDRRRTEILNVAGYRLLRFTCREALGDAAGVLARIAREIDHQTVAGPAAPQVG